LDETTQNLIRISLNGSHKMNNIINELLLLASIRKEDVPLAPVNMAEVVSQALNRLSLDFEKYRPELVCPDHWPQAQGYAPWVEEVWVNYLSNGLKYGGQPPRLALGAALQPDGLVRFWVRDNGPGLSPAAQARLFTEFTRLDRTRAQGHGLGLSIVRRIMEKLSGQFGLESSPGRGSLFYFSLRSVD
jgi:signal transduction histidine kinase